MTHDVVVRDALLLSVLIFGSTGGEIAITYGMKATGEPAELRPVGETEFVADQAEESVRTGGAEIAAIMGTADLRLGARVEEVLAAHEAAGRGRFRGVRYITAHDEYRSLQMGANAGIMEDETYRQGVRKLGELGYTYDAFCFHPQIPAFVEVAQP